jgi:N-acetylglucosamine-6-sulfatase
MDNGISRRTFMAQGAAAAGLAGLTAVQAAGQAGAAPPTDGARNIVFILTDDQRYDALGFMGHPFLETPHLDELARNGMVFENAFVTTALCSPSRACILTGLYTHAHGVRDNLSPLDDSLMTFPQELRKAGYETAYVGKWHMGGESDEPRPGFDRWVSFRGQGVYVNPQFNVDGERVKREGYVTDLITDYAEEFLRKPREKPFCLYVGHKAVHAEFRPAPRHKGCYADKVYPPPASMANTDENYAGKPDWVRAQRQSWHGVDGMYNREVQYDPFTRDYAETLRAVDDSVGRIVATLKELGLLESTLVVFTSDNGFQFGEHGLIDKRTMYETSIRVPLIAHCPGLFAGGQRRKEMVVNLDFAPTFLELAGCKVPEGLHGRSFLPLLKGEATPWREAFLYEYFWERDFPQTPTVFGVRTDRYKFMQYHGVWDRYELYDLENDPDEMHNLLGDFQVRNEAGRLDHWIRTTAKPELKALFEEMLGRLTNLLEETGGTNVPVWRR